MKEQKNEPKETTNVDIITCDKYKIKENLKLGPLATFTPNKKLPIYNWFYYKEGYAKDLVFLLAEEFGLEKGDTLVDPFCGVGTSLVACKELGINAVGFDIAAMTSFIANSKVQDYDIDMLKEEAKKLLKKRFSEQETAMNRIDLPLVKKAFSRHALSDLLFFRKEINKIKARKVHDFFKLALMNVTTKVTYAMKEGAVLKIKKKGRNIPPVRALLKRQINIMIKDLENTTFDSETLVEARQGDARYMKLPAECCEAIITSPPYLNKIEYAKVYTIEKYLYFRNKKEPALRSFLGLDTKVHIEDPFDGKYPLPLVAKAYFKDMNEMLKESFRILRPGGNCAIVVANGCFPDRLVESDTLIAELGENLGFKVESITAVNKRWCTKQRTIKIGEARESIIWLSKPE